jgi:hypothetical protein
MPLLVRDKAALRQHARLGYETRILEHGVIEVRQRCWHDLFNVLVWQTFPRAKAALNECHCAELGRDPGERLRRGRLRDALTLIDESGVVVGASDPSLLDAVRKFRWKELFWNRRAHLDQCLRVHVVGHAVYEKLLFPYVGLTGYAVLFELDQAEIEAPPAAQVHALDSRLANALRDNTSLMSPQGLHPVPLLGLPGWHPDAARENFYEDHDYFRPGRKARRQRGSCIDVRE